jgi:hypothetical protein
MQAAPLDGLVEAVVLGVGFRWTAAWAIIDHARSRWDG